MRAVTLKSLVVTLLLALVSTPPAASQDTVYTALIADLSGTVQVARAQERRFGPAVWGMQLYPGDRIKTLAESGVVILLSNNTLIELGSNGSVTISNGPSLASSKSIQIESNVYGTLANLTSRASNDDVGALAGLRSGASGAGIEILSPRSTNIKTDRPSFSWRASGDFDRFTVKLYNPDGIVWSRAVNETQIDYPQDEPGLQPGSAYFWRVEGERLLDETSSNTVEFSVLSEEELRGVTAGEAMLSREVDLEAESIGYHFLLGTYYIESGLLESAIRSFLHIAEAHPDAALPREILGKLYWQIGLHELGLTQLETAVELSRRH